MSSFGGRMREYIDVSLDRFDGENLESTVYFLSHKHEDHMVGLSSSNFVYRLQSNSHIKLYCSDVTRDLLLADDRFTGLAKSLVVQELEVPCIIPVPDPTTGKVKYHVTVTLIPAGHCPGSVMFLFEGSEGTALYTGDFRLARGDIPRVECLKSGNSAKPIDSLYVDTTFCVPEAYYIPSREDCTAAIIKVVERWTACSPDHIVLLHHRAALGYEHLFVELAQHFNTKIHLSKRKFDQCKRVKALPDFGTLDGSSTQIHACKWAEEPKRKKWSALPCGHCKSGDASRLQVKKITVSTMWFTHNVGMEEIVVTPKPTSPRYLRACYSFHSSYSEVRDVVTYLNPRRIFPNVIPMKHTQKRIQERLNNFLKLASASKSPSTPSKPRLLGKQRPPQKRPLTISNSQSTDSDLLFDDSPRKPKKQKKSSSNEDTKKDNGDEMSLTWDASQNTEGNGESEADVDSSYVGSQRSNASAMDLVASDFDLTPKKAVKTDSQSTHEPMDGMDTDVKVSSGARLKKAVVNGFGGEHSEELFSDNEDDEVLSVREAFKPFKDGSYGSHVTYASDTDLSDCEEEDHNGKDIVIREDGEKGGDCEGDKEHKSKCQNGQSFSEKDEPVTEENMPDKQTTSVSTCTKLQQEEGLDSKEVKSSKNQEQSAESSDKSICIEENKEASKEKSPDQGSVGKSVSETKTIEDDDDEDVIMLDSDEEGEIAGEVPELTTDDDDEEEEGEDEDDAPPQPSTSKKKVHEVIDLTAEDEDDDIVSMGVRKAGRKFMGEEGDGYHGDTESELNDTDGIMTDSDSSFAKASYEKTKTRMRNGRSRRAQVMNGNSSSESDSDSDVTLEEPYTAPMRYPIAGSCHYSKTRLNGFHSTLVDTEVIVLDDHDDEPPPNMTVVDIADKDKAAEASKSTLASAEDLVSGAMEMASAATSAAKSSTRLVSTIQRLKMNIHKPVLASSAASAKCETSKQTARKSTSVAKLSPKKSPPGRNKAQPSGQEAVEAEVVEMVQEDRKQTEIRDISPSKTAVVVQKEPETNQSHKSDCAPDISDSGKIGVAQSDQESMLQQAPSEGLLR